MCADLPARRSRALLRKRGLDGSGRSRASIDDCSFILDRIVETELAAAGIRDPALAARKKAQLRIAVRADLLRCQRTVCGQVPSLV
ncbi:MAG TPA: hypothetical protein VG963_22690 [Polyangiaceae bacterium]|nr:hypothetical protein [Polyangiaceae bacterium]